MKISDITRQCQWGGYEENIQTLFPMQWAAFRDDVPKSRVYEGEENWRKEFVLEIEFEKDFPIGRRPVRLRLEVWSKGGDWNDNYFFYFCVGGHEDNGELYFIPQLSPKYNGEESETVEIMPELQNIMQFVKERFLTPDGKVREEFKQYKVEIDEN